LETCFCVFPKKNRFRGDFWGAFGDALTYNNICVVLTFIYVTRAAQGDQASIVGGAINYVRELEQLLQSLEVQKSIRSRAGAGAGAADSSPFAGFFSFPQYSATTSSAHGGCSGNSTNTGSGGTRSDAAAAGAAGAAGSAVADVEVTMVEGHASLKVLARRRPKQLLKLVAGLHQLRIPPLHLNVTTVDAMVLYTFSLKVIYICLFVCLKRIIRRTNCR
jgi:hypothetical protein